MSSNEDDENEWWDEFTKDQKETIRREAAIDLCVAIRDYCESVGLDICTKISSDSILEFIKQYDSSD